MKYMLLIYGAEADWTEETRKACMLESMAIADELAAQGKYVASAPLHSVTTEQLGGYYVIDVEHLDEAIAIASRLPPAVKGTVEIRPVFDLSGIREGEFPRVAVGDSVKG